MGKVCYMYVTYEMQILMPCVIECVLRSERGADTLIEANFKPLSLATDT